MVMQFTISSSTLSKQLTTINGVIVNNPVIPILENFLFDIDGEELTVTASDLQTSITAKLSIEAHERTRIAIPARILRETLRNLPEQPVTFSIDEATHGVEISSNNGKYRLAGENATDFPQPSLIQKGISVDMDAQVLKKMISQTIIAASHDELRPAMNGVYMDFNGNNVTFVATDGHRLARYIRSDVSVETQQPFIVPRKALNLLHTLLPNEAQQVNITFNDNHVHFSMGNKKMITRLIDERYPDYENVIPTNNAYKLVIDRMYLLSSLKRMVIYANRTTYQIKLSITHHELLISAEDFDFSNGASERLDCTYKGDDLDIGFNARFLIELLSNLHTKDVTMYFAAPSKATLILPGEKETYEDILLLIMPVILK